MKKIILMCLLLTSCMQAGTSLLWEENSDIFRQMLYYSKPALIKYEIIDKDGHWYEPVFSLKSNDFNAYAQVIYNKLSPDFLYPNINPEVLPKTFKEMLTASDEVAYGSHSLIIKRTNEELSFNLAARYESKEREAWLVACNIKYPKTDEQKTYYMLIENPFISTYLKPIIVGTFECKAGVCTSNGEFVPTGEYELFTIEVERGVKDVLDPSFTKPIVEESSINKSTLTN